MSLFNYNNWPSPADLSLGSIHQGVTNFFNSAKSTAEHPTDSSFVQNNINKYNNTWQDASGGLINYYHNQLYQNLSGDVIAKNFNDASANFWNDTSGIYAMDGSASVWSDINDNSGSKQGWYNTDTGQCVVDESIVNPNNLLKYDASAPGMVFISMFLSRLIIFIALVIYNAYLMYIIQDMPATELNSWFPTDCKAYPYGTEDSNPCNVGLSEKEADELEIQLENRGKGLEQEKLSSEVMGDATLAESEPTLQATPGIYPSPKIGGAPKDAFNAQTTEELKSQLYELGKKILENTVTPPQFPYYFYQQYANTVGGLYKNWFINALTEANIGLNQNIKNVLRSDVAQSMPKWLLIFVAFFILIGIVIFGGMTFKGLALMYYQFIGMYRVSSFTVKLLVLLTAVFIFMFNVFSVGYTTLLLLFKLIVFPMIYIPFREIGAILHRYKVLLINIITFIMIWTLTNDTPLNPVYKTMVTTIVWTVYVFFTVLQVMNAPVWTLNVEYEVAQSAPEARRQKRATN
jgi:hypothetical protein